MSEWSWFTGELHKENIVVKKDPPIFKDYNLIAKNKSDITIIEEHINEISADIISKYQLLTPEFIDKYADKLDWYYICEYQELPDWLMRKHIDKLNWGQISWYQNMTEDFINEYKNMFNIEKIYKNNKLKSLRHIIR